MGCKMTPMKASDTKPSPYESSTKTLIGALQWLADQSDKVATDGTESAVLREAALRLEALDIDRQRLERVVRTSISCNAVVIQEALM